LLQVTLFDGQVCWLNPDHILMIEARPDTLIRFANGEKWLVRESVSLIQERFIHYKQACFQSLHRPEVSLASEADEPSASPPAM
jgi:uncharacterized protein YlzI (FlbEa/FlbD family)